MWYHLVEFHITSCGIYTNHSHIASYNMLTPHQSQSGWLSDDQLSDDSEDNEREAELLSTFMAGASVRICTCVDVLVRACVCVASIRVGSWHAGLEPLFHVHTHAQTYTACNEIVACRYEGHGDL